MRNAGKIKKLDNPRLLPPNMAIFPAHFEKAVLDIKIVLDGQNKIIGLWFLPHESEIPVLEENTVTLELPFTGKWMVFWGGDTAEQNQHLGVANQKYAFDLVRVDKNGKTYKNEGVENEDYFAFGKKVLAPAVGVVTEVIRGVRDNRPGSMNPYSALGNAVFIEHRKNEVSVLAHFKQKSILVKVGDKVRKGQPLGLCGNSGNSSEPHIHYHLQNTPIIQDGTGIKCHFEGVIVTINGKEQLKGKYSPLKGDIVRSNTE
jgi:biotin carboxyl carrier protein